MEFRKMQLSFNEFEVGDIVKSLYGSHFYMVLKVVKKPYVLLEAKGLRGMSKARLLTI